METQIPVLPKINNTKWKPKVKYYTKEPHLTYNVYDSYYPGFVMDFIHICLNEEIEFHRGFDGELYVVVRLETSPVEEDGFLVFVRLLDIYLMAFAMKGISMYQFVKVDEHASGFGFSEGYSDLGGLDAISIGPEQFNLAIERIVYFFRNNDDNLDCWKQDIARISVFTSESVRNKYVFYDNFRRNPVSGFISPWSDPLIHGWKSCSKIAYNHDPDITPTKLSDAELALIECLSNFNGKIVGQYSSAIEASPVVCYLLMSIKWDYRAKHRLWTYINSMLTTNKGGMELSKIESQLERKYTDYKVPRGQLKHILRELLQDNKLEKCSQDVYRKIHEERKSKTSSSSQTKKALLNVVLIGDHETGKTSLKDTLTKRGGEDHFETNNKRFTLLDAEEESYMPNIIAKADICILVVSSLSWNVGASPANDVLTMKHARLAKQLTPDGSKLLIVVNKMEEATIDWSRATFEDLIVPTMRQILSKKCGYTEERTKFLPISGKFDQNVLSKVGKTICPWFDGMSLLEELDMIQVPSRDSEAGFSFRMPISKKIKKSEMIFVFGKVEYGTVKTGNQMLIMPNNMKVTVGEIFINNKIVLSAGPGETPQVQVKSVTDKDFPVGCVLCSKDTPNAPVDEFTAALHILDVQDVVFDAGCKVTLHVHSLVVECEIVNLIRVWRRGLANEDVSPVIKGVNVECRIKPITEIHIEEYVLFKKLGQIVLTARGKLVAVGRVRSRD